MLGRERDKEKTCSFNLQVILAPEIKLLYLFSSIEIIFSFSFSFLSNFVPLFSSSNVGKKKAKKKADCSGRRMSNL